MQRAILLVLILIAVILAPWLLGVIAVLVAAYGLWIVVGAVVMLLTVAVILLVFGFKGSLFPKPDASSRVEQTVAEVNRLYREGETARRAVTAEQEVIRAAELARIRKAREVTCKKCNASIARHSMYCPKCGASPL